MKALKIIFITLCMITISLAADRQVESNYNYVTIQTFSDQEDKSINMDNKKFLGSVILSSIAILSAESSESTSCEEDDCESSDSDEDNHSVEWYEYDSNKEGFKMLIQLFPQVRLIQEVKYEKRFQAR